MVQGSLMFSPAFPKSLMFPSFAAAIEVCVVHTLVYHCEVNQGQFPGVTSPQTSLCFTRFIHLIEGSCRKKPSFEKKLRARNLQEKNQYCGLDTDC